MSSKRRLDIFKKLPLRAQLATIAASKANPVLAKDLEYIANLERIHAESLAIATPEALTAYHKAKEILNS